MASGVFASLSPLVGGLLVATPLVIGFGQILFKMAGDRFAATGKPFMWIAVEPLFVAACALYGVATFMWVYVLKSVPLSFAYSFMALSYVLVPVLAWWLLGESVGLRYAVGTSLIIVGLLVAQS